MGPVKALAILLNEPTDFEDTRMHFFKAPATQSCKGENLSKMSFDMW
jgi:hypothetical protein